VNTVFSEMLLLTYIIAGIQIWFFKKKKWM